MPKQELTQARLKELFKYNSRTGIFIRRVKTANSTAIGEAAGSVNKKLGYVQINVDGVKYYAHRLAWLYIHGVMPINVIDHRDTVRSNNRIKNLRHLTCAENLQNKRKAHKNSVTGFQGVVPRGNSFRAKIGIDGKQKMLGTYTTPELAHLAYVDAKRDMHSAGTL